MKIFKLITFIISFVVISVNFNCVYACTGMQLKSADNVFINGRTVEFGVKITTNVIVVPRNYKFIGSLPNNEAGMNYQSKYAFVGATMYNTPLVVDGINEKGLSVGAFYFPGYASYSTVTAENKQHALSPLDFNNWLLSQFATVDEVKNALNNVVIAPTIFKTWNLVPPFHYVVYDKTGNSVVIEPTNNKLIVYDNPIGVITNSPTFDWHMTNLQNYLNLSVLNVPKVSVKGVDLKQFGEGSGLHGLPGDFTPPARFVRAAVFSSSAIPAENADQTVLQMFHLLNQFDIPVGAVRSVDKGVLHTDQTLFTTVKNPQNNRYYIRTYEDQNIKVVDLNKFDLNASNIKIIPINSKQTIDDISNLASTLPK